MRFTLIVVVFLIFTSCSYRSYEVQYSQSELSDDLNLNSQNFIPFINKELKVSYIGDYEDAGGFFITNSVIDTLSSDTIFFKKEFNFKWVFILTGDSTKNNEVRVIGDSTGYYKRVYYEVVEKGTSKQKEYRKP